MKEPMDSWTLVRFVFTNYDSPYAATMQVAEICLTFALDRF